MPSGKSSIKEIYSLTTFESLYIFWSPIPSFQKRNKVVGPLVDTVVFAVEFLCKKGQGPCSFLYHDIVAWLQSLNDRKCFEGDFSWKNGGILKRR